MPIASGEKVTNTESTKSDQSQQKKKKSPRVRVRPRNKAFRAATTPVEVLQEKTATTSPQVKTPNEFLENNQHNNKSTMPTSPPPKEEPHVNSIANNDVASEERSRELIKANREAKRKAKLAKKGKAVDGTANLEAASIESSVSTLTLRPNNVTDSENKQQTKLPDKVAVPVRSQNIEKPIAVNEIEKTKVTLSKAERRAIQEAQRAAKAQAQLQKSKNTNIRTTATVVANPEKSGAGALVAKEKSTKASSSPESQSPGKLAKSIGKSNNDGNVKLFSHLERANPSANLYVNNPLIHPVIARLGEQYAKRTVVGSNARCMAFLSALKKVIQDFETPANKEFVRSLETTLKYDVKHLHACRPLAVSVLNAYKHINNLLTQLPSDNPESDSKERLCQFIDTYIENQIGKAAEAISESMQDKIKNGDVILTFGCSSLINYICKQAHGRHVDFRVIVVDSRPFCDGQEMLRRLTDNGISCTYVFINAVGFVMPEATKVLMGAHALLSNGYVMARTGTAQVALVARSYNVPVLVCCETHKFSERFQTDAIVYNELGDPEDLVRNKACSLNNWQSKSRMTPLNLMYDITPPELVTAVVTDVSILPCTSVPVILRIKPAEIGYYG